ncbi:MAG: prepilin-type N-terminal cleavage/methylation domain-containing protein [Pseudohongiella sp.]|nr:prepilin-type N-terminal cleavage/methylation domain-containing protein [Pseudohongiella sp.]
MSIRSKQHGVTLIEMVAVIVILAIALTAVTQVISVSISRSSDTLLETRAVALAQSYLDEILSKRFDEKSAPRGIPPCHNTHNPCTSELLFGVDGGEVRALFDDVDDYHQLQEGDGFADPLRDSEGQTRQGYENFMISVEVRYLRPCNEEAAWFQFPPEICSPDQGDPVAVAESADTLLDAGQSAKLVRITVSHREQLNGWHFSVYKANF